MVKPPDVLAPALKVNDRIVGCMPGMSRCGRLCAIWHGGKSEIPHSSTSQMKPISPRIKYVISACQSDMPQPPIALSAELCLVSVIQGEEHARPMDRSRSVFGAADRPDIRANLGARAAP